MKGKWCSFQGYQKKHALIGDTVGGRILDTLRFSKLCSSKNGIFTRSTGLPEFFHEQMAQFLSNSRTFCGGRQREPTVGSDVPFTSPKTNMEPQKTTGFVQIIFCFNFRVMAFSVPQKIKG